MQLQSLSWAVAKGLLIPFWFVPMELVKDVGLSREGKLLTVAVCVGITDLPQVSLSSLSHQF